MADSEFEMDGIRYSYGKLPAMQQLHVLRKLGPMIAKIGPSFMLDTPTDMSDMLLRAAPALEEFANMPEADVDYVLQRCLAVVKRYQDPGAWIPVWNNAAKRMQFEDIDMMSMLVLAFRVLGESLGNFSNSAGQISQELASAVSQSNTSVFPTVKIS